MFLATDFEVPLMPRYGQAGYLATRRSHGTWQRSCLEVFCLPSLRWFVVMATGLSGDLIVQK